MPDSILDKKLNITKDGIIFLYESEHTKIFKNHSFSAISWQLTTRNTNQYFIL